MQLNCKDNGFTVVELLIVFIVIAVLSGFLFPIGNRLKQQAKIVSIKTDALRYQRAFEDYYTEYHRYPSWCPLDRWFDLSLYVQEFIDSFGGDKTEFNPEEIRFCEMSAQELTSKSIPFVQFFLLKKGTLKSVISTVPKGTKIYGDKVIFFIPDE